MLQYGGAQGSKCTQSRFPLIGAHAPPPPAAGGNLKNVTYKKLFAKSLFWALYLTFFYCSTAFTQGLIHLSFISESALDRLFEDYLHGPSKPDRGSPSIVKANEEPNVYADEPEVSIDFRHDGMESGNSVVAKRYYYGRRCNISRLSRKAFVELIKTGKLCGRRVAAIRFGLTGR